MTVAELPPTSGSPYRIGLVCLGNICRSPMAHVVLQSLVDDAGLDDRVQVTSCGTGPWHVGQEMDARAAATLLAAGHDPSDHRGRQLDATWAGHDVLLAMDADNLADVRAALPATASHLFRDWDPLGSGDVPDPYFGGDDGFAEVLAMVERTCETIVAHLEARTDG